MNTLEDNIEDTLEDNLEDMEDNMEDSPKDNDCSEKSQKFIPDFFVIVEM